jgi:hypothetical protein
MSFFTKLHLSARTRRLVEFLRLRCNLLVDCAFNCAQCSAPRSCVEAGCSRSTAERRGHFRTAQQGRQRSAARGGREFRECPDDSGAGLRQTTVRQRSQQPAASAGREVSEICARIVFTDSTLSRAGVAIAAFFRREFSVRDLRAQGLRDSGQRAGEHLLPAPAFRQREQRTARVVRQRRHQRIEFRFIRR